METDILRKPALLAEMLAHEGPVVLLESQSPGHPAGKTTYLAARPGAVLKVTGTDPWERLSEFRSKAKDWLFGYLGYDLKNYLEDLQSENPDPVGAPDLWFMVPELLLRWDSGSGLPEVIKGNLSGLPGRSDWPGFPRPVVFGPEPTVDKRAYIDAIEEVQRRILEGEFYEVNLSHQLEGGFKGSAAALYRRMKEVGPVPFGAYLSLSDEEIEICSQSPERFLRKEGRVVFSQPIKGTIQRSDDEKEDRRLREVLAKSAKDRAENLMIVDLVRNDLGRIALTNSVRVSSLFEIQSFGTVHQMVSTVEAEAAVEDPVEIIKACYPMGSMTGAPKIRAMKTIEELENYRRGIYSGAIGYFTPEADFDFNVVIRTAIIRKDKLWYPVGGAITSDSDPEAEWQETLVKARALTHASRDMKKEE